MSHKNGSNGFHKHGGSALEPVEIHLLVDAIYEAYGYDFREYAYASLKRRITRFMYGEGLSTLSSLHERILGDREALERFVLTFSAEPGPLFAEPELFATIRQKVAPWLHTYPFIRIWHVGCATGEEVYSMAILLQEEGLYDRARIYATDMDETVLKKAREGIFSLDQLDQFELNHRAAGGKMPLQEYYNSAYGHGIFRSALRKNIVFSRHNLTTDGSFNEFHVIFCRNVLGYFKKNLQNRVHNLIYESLGRFGVLALGAREDLQLTPHEHQFELLEPGVKLYRRIG